MAEDLDALEDWAAGLLDKAGPGERRKLARAVAIDLRRDQAQRIAAQQNPDGTPFEPRKKKSQNLRGKGGRIRRRASARAQPMFVRLRGTSFLRWRASEDEASAGFSASVVSRIARVHQEGLRDRVARKPGSPEVVYPRRILLGFSDGYRERLLDLVLRHLGADSP